MIDLAVCGEGTITYSVGVGGQHEVDTEASWTAIEGPHVVTWTVSSDNDPNPTNNLATQSFTVAPAGTQIQTSTTQSEAATQITSLETSQAQSSITQVTTELSQTTQQQTAPMTVTATSELAGDLIDMLQQNSLLIIGGLAILAVILAIALRRRRPVSHERETSKPSAGANQFCPSCGRENPSTSQFCSKCGSRLI
jgi:hypothetical protein